MDAPLNKLPNDAETLREMVLQKAGALTSLEKELQDKDAKLKHQKDLIDQLLEAIRLSKHQHFGTRSEKFNAEQLDFLLNEIGVSSENEPSEGTDSDESEKTVVKSFTIKRCTM